ncbi:MAG: thiamine pyrophosphate-dependent dehydrogenase E1 component subunit alpha [Verrucomicrobiales bacterium]|jgi:pyruvate dehydrogenase E1 component alpha subunit/2-oxoisovalerate dehydrogenase E1 component alpha subunit|nr:thiamine pyrophosphate-dependent dehydrogenase E1 component subunit alpha [Verrucomicrobiales bacterium]
MTDIASQNTDDGMILPEAFNNAFRWMVLARTFEEKIANVYRAGKIVGGVYVGRGQEAFSAALAVQLQKGKDVYAPLIRDMAGRAAFGEPVIDAARTYMGSAKGSMRGRDGNIHRGSPREGVPAMISHLGAMISVVSGMLFARRLRGELGDTVGAACIGDGATSTGSVHEALNMAAVEKLPLVVAVANNQFAYSTPNTRQFACKDLVDRAIGYGIEGTTVDGTDLADCLQGFQGAISRAKAGKGPQLVIGTLLRLAGHGEHDDSHYIPDDIRSSEIGKDCLAVAREKLIAEGWNTEDDCKNLEKQAAEEVENAILKAGGEQPPDPYSHDWNACYSERFRDNLTDQ